MMNVIRMSISYPHVAKTTDVTCVHCHYVTPRLFVISVLEFLV